MHRAIDVHGHYGTCLPPADEVRGDLRQSFFSGDIDIVLLRAAAVGVDRTIVSPLRALMPDGADCSAANDESLSLADVYPQMRFWAVLNPRLPDAWEQATRVLRHPQCMGIKIHPVTHGYDIKDEGRRVFAFAAEHGAITISHTGQAGAAPADFVPFLNEQTDLTFIFAHLGNSDRGDPSEQVEAVRQCRGANVCVDTSSTASMFSGLIEWAVRELGSERVLFGSDTPLYSVAAHKARIVHAELSETDKQNILYTNAVRLFGQARLGTV